MKNIIILYIMIISIAFPINVFAINISENTCRTELDSKSIVMNMAEKYKGNVFVKMKMSIVRPSKTKDFELSIWSSMNNYMILIRDISNNKEKVLMSCKSILWEYDSSINKLIKLPKSMLNEGVMGSDYFITDLFFNTLYSNDYKYIIKGEKKIEEFNCWEIELLAQNDASNNAKIVCWISKDDYINIKSEYYNEGMNLKRTICTKKVNVFDDILLPSKIEILPMPGLENETIIKIISYKKDIIIPKSFFTKKNMKSFFR